MQQALATQTGLSLSVTASFGVATADFAQLHGDTTAAALIALADTQLYLSKAAGRDQVTGCTLQAGADSGFEAALETELEKQCRVQRAAANTAGTAPCAADDKPAGQPEPVRRQAGRR